MNKFFDNLYLLSLNAHPYNVGRVLHRRLRWIRKEKRKKKDNYVRTHKRSLRDCTRAHINRGGNQLKSKTVLQ